MRVLYDDDVLSVQVCGGISRYFTQLIEALGAVADIEMHLPFWLTVNTHLAASLAVVPALAEVLRTDADLSLVCFGGGPLTVEEAAPSRQPASCPGSWPYAVMIDLWPPSTLAPSRSFIPLCNEGFGMPMREAMINRCPVLIPRLSCFPAIAADAALYFDPAQADGTMEILNRLARDASLRRRLAEAGARRAACFTWQRSAAQHAALYRSLAS